MKKWFFKHFHHLLSVILISSFVINIFICTFSFCRNTSTTVSCDFSFSFWMNSPTIFLEYYSEHHCYYCIQLLPEKITSILFSEKGYSFGVLVFLELQSWFIAAHQGRFIGIWKNLNVYIQMFCLTLKYKLGMSYV